MAPSKTAEALPGADMGSRTRNSEDVSCGRRKKKMNGNERAGQREEKVSQRKEEAETGACPEKAT